MRLIRAELLKARRRSATWILLIILLVLMAVVFLLGGVAFQGIGIIEFPTAYVIISQLAFGLGGLLAIIYAAALVGADWNWGVVRNVIARGESRANYLLAKAAAIAIILGIALVVVFLAGIGLAYVSGALWNVPVASPLRGRGIQDLADWLFLIYPVLLQRAAIGFVVALILRSQLAGAVVGVLLYLGEPIFRFIFGAVSFIGRGPGSILEEGPRQIGPEWYQFLPISIGDYVVNSAPGNVSLQGGLEGLLIRPVPLEIALPGVLVYLALFIGLAIVVFRRQEIA